MDNQLFFNGINGATGSYLTPPLTAEQVAKLAKGEPTGDEAHQRELKRRTQRGDAHFGVRAGVDPADLAEAGWGIVFAHGDPQIDAIREALTELLVHRREQAGERYREFVQEEAYRPGESKDDFLSRHGAGPGPVNPKIMPYYLLLVGSPEQIPFYFQYQLDVQHAVGRLHFDSVDAYAIYARGVVEQEMRGSTPDRPPRAVFFGTQNLDDPPTILSASQLVMPLAAELADDHPTWAVERVPPMEATKARLLDLLGGQADQTPTLLFTASHGMGFPREDARQLAQQGALLCQDWPGPVQWQRDIPQDFYVAADDVSDSARVDGLIAFHFACYGAGTPRLGDFAHAGLQERGQIAPHAFLSQLPQRLLGHPGGGALAAIGHVERAWGYSFQWPGDGIAGGSQVEAFRSSLYQIMAGQPVGAALEYLNERYAELSTELTRELEDIKFGKRVDDLRLAGMWTANNDARAYVILGDPAVRLAVSSARGDAGRGRRGEGGTRGRGEGETRAGGPASNLTRRRGERFDESIEGAAGGPFEPEVIENGADGARLDKVITIDDVLRNDPLRNDALENNGSREEKATVNLPSNQRTGVRVVSPPEPTMPVDSPQASAANDDVPSYLPVPKPPPDSLMERDPALYYAWRNHTAQGFSSSRQMQQRIEDAFMRSHNITVWLYIVLFGVGVAAFVTAVICAVAFREIEYVLIFGGLSTAAFLTYFFSRPLQSLEQNLQLISWLGIVYNTYWTRLLYSQAEQDIEDIGRDTTKEIEKILDKHTSLFGGRERFGDSDEPGGCLSLLLRFGGKGYEGEVEAKAREKREG